VSDYGLDDPDRYVELVGELSSKLWIWPPVEEAKRGGRKYDLVMELDQVAAEKTFTARPTTTLVDLQRPLIFPEHVYKREHSECHLHVFLPTQSKKKATIAKLRKESCGGRYRWLAQTYAPLLRSIGEWRIFMVNRQPIQAVATTRASNDKEWHWTVKQQGHSLEEMR
jgi:hypothetical protein